MRLRRGRSRVRVLSLGYLPPELGGSQRGGIATFHVTLLEEFARNRDYGIQVTGVFVAPPDELDLDRAAQCPAPVLGHRQPTRPRRRYRRLLERAQPDVVILNHITNLYLSRWARLHRSLAPGVPAIGIAHSWHPVTRHEGEEAKRRLGIAQAGVDAVDALCFGSDHCKREGEQLGIAFPATAEVIHYPLQHTYLAPTAVEGQPRSGIAYVGSLLRRKNVASLIRAVAARPGLKLVIAGEGPEEGELRALSDRLGAADRITFRRHLPVDQHLPAMRDLMLDSAALCLPSTSESFGLVMIEALACGTPVVGFGPSMSELEGLAGIRCGEPLSGADPDEIGAALDRVMAREWDREELRRRVVQAFEPQRAASAYAHLIRRLARREAAPDLTSRLVAERP
jgi:glycosyltransferase involved in cell wall biosynthesis